MPSKPQVAIVGVGEGMGGRATGKTTIQLYAEAFASLIQDCPIAPSEIDAVLTSSPDAEPHHMFSTWLTEYLGLHPKFTSAVQMGGATPHSNIALATASETAPSLVITLSARPNRRTLAALL